MNVLIGQCDQFQGHEHEFFVPKEFLVVPEKFGASVSDIWDDPILLNKKHTSNVSQKDGFSVPRIGDETRSKNVSVVFWKRIA